MFLPAPAFLGRFAVPLLNTLVNSLSMLPDAPARLIAVLNALVYVVAVVFAVPPDSLTP